MQLMAHAFEGIVRPSVINKIAEKHQNLLGVRAAHKRALAVLTQHPKSKGAQARVEKLTRDLVKAEKAMRPR